MLFGSVSWTGRIARRCRSTTSEAASDGRKEGPLKKRQTGDPTKPGVKPPTLDDVLGITTTEYLYSRSRPEDMSKADLIKEITAQRNQNKKFRQALRAVQAHCDCHGHHIARVALEGTE